MEGCTHEERNKYLFDDKDAWIPGSKTIPKTKPHRIPPIHVHPTAGILRQIDQA